MILSKKYKDQMDKIIMSENMKKRILNNVLEIDKQKNKFVKKNKNIVYKRSMGLLAACCTIIICINFNKLFSKIFKLEHVNSKQIEISEDKNSSSNKKEKNTTIENEYKSIRDGNNNVKKESESSNNSHNEKSISKSFEENLNSKNTISNVSEIEISKDTDSLNKNIKRNNSINKETSKSIIAEDSDTNSSVSNEGISVTSSDMGLTNDKLRSVSSDEISKIKQVNTMEEAQNEVDFKFKCIQTLPEGYDINNINVIPQELVQIEYGNGENTINFKIQTESIVENYNTYPFEKNININGETIELKGYDDKLVHSASWNSENISYSISSSSGIEYDTLKSIINSIS